MERWPRFAGELGIGDDEVRIEDHHRTEPVTGRASPLGAVEGKAGRRQWTITRAANQAGGLFTENQGVCAQDIHGDKAF